MNDKSNNLLEMRGITKYFPGVVANSDVDFDVRNVEFVAQHVAVLGDDFDFCCHHGFLLLRMSESCKSERKCHERVRKCQKRIRKY